MDLTRGSIILGLALLGLLTTALAEAKVTLASPFGDHMVLQRDHPVLGGPSRGSFLAEGCSIGH